MVVRVERVDRVGCSRKERKGEGTRLTIAERK